MSVAIDVMFAGLIALVPNAAPDASSITAYLVKDQYHKADLEVYGKASIQLIGAGNSCAKKKTIVCNLDNTDIEVLGQPSGPLRHLPDRPVRGRERPNNLGDEESTDWIVRMKKIEVESGLVIGNAKTWSALKPYVGARMTFGWDTTIVNELDGREAGPPVLIGFKDSNGTQSKLKQAVAESLVFQFSVNSPRIVIRVTDRSSGKWQEIQAGCQANRCLAMRVFNTYTGVSVGDGDHFKHYYDLVSNPGNRMMPYSIDWRPGVRKIEEMNVDFNLLGGILRIVRPAAREDVAKIRANLPGAKIKSLGDLRHFLVKVLGPSSATTDLVLGPLQLMNRAICPPVLLEP